MAWCVSWSSETGEQICVALKTVLFSLYLADFTLKHVSFVVKMGMSLDGDSVKMWTREGPERNSDNGID